uniref:Uncharacterized protein n=1 Tax=Oryza barthii TaxID=65489 RepID=A0A0D3FDS3_9ORYZ
MASHKRSSAGERPSRVCTGKTNSDMVDDSINHHHGTTSSVTFYSYVRFRFHRENQSQCRTPTTGSPE